MNLVPYPLLGVGRPMLTRLLAAGLAIALLTLAVDVLLIVRMDPNSPVHRDGPYYIGLARSMAAGRGYYLEASFWPDKPEVGRSPLWPALLTLPSFLFSHANDNALLRYTGAAVHGGAAALLMLLTFQLTGSLVGSVLAGVFLGLYPPASALVFGGYSEPVYLLVTFAGLILAFEGGKLAWFGVLLGGIGVLSRSNYVVLPEILLGVTALFRPKSLRSWSNLRLWVLGAVLFSTPSAIWIVRNYAVSGYFPVLSAMEGETLYGGNNARVANDLNWWGYWIMPNEIPGEQTKQALAATRTEVELNKYYHDRAVEFIRDNWFSWPRLLVGKLVRGFVPVPWAPLAASYVAFLCRACVYAAFIAACFLWRGHNVPYSLLVGAMFLVTLETTVIYYGAFRFTFCVEPFLFPFIVAAGVGLWNRRRAGVAV
jgi:hypothetical protein